jgi:hypothetical protein
MKPMSLEKQAMPVPAGEFDESMEDTGEKTFLEQYMENQPRPAPKVGGAPPETAPGDESEE